MLCYEPGVESQDSAEIWWLQGRRWKKSWGAACTLFPPYVLSKQFYIVCSVRALQYACRSASACQEISRINTVFFKDFPIVFKLKGVKPSLCQGSNRACLCERQNCCSDIITVLGLVGCSQFGAISWMISGVYAYQRNRTSRCQTWVVFFELTSATVQKDWK